MKGSRTRIHNSLIWLLGLSEELDGHIYVLIQILPLTTTCEQKEKEDGKPREDLFGELFVKLRQGGRGSFEICSFSTVCMFG